MAGDQESKNLTNVDFSFNSVADCKFFVEKTVRAEFNMYIIK